MSNMVLGVFSDADNAERAIYDLNTLGYNPKDMSIVMKDESSGNLYQSTGASIAEGAASGATTGGIIGGLAGLLIGLGAVAVPVLGGLLIAGPLAAALGLTGVAATTVSGAVTGVIAGGIVGGLIGLGVPEEEAASYENRIKEGGILVAVPVMVGRENEVKEIFQAYQADQVKSVSNNTYTKRVDLGQPAFYSEVKKRKTSKKRTKK